MNPTHPADVDLDLTSTEYALDDVLPWFRIAADGGASSYSMSGNDVAAGVQDALIFDGLIEAAEGTWLNGTTLRITPKGRRALALREYHKRTRKSA